jgi:hypothetical protein
LEKKRRRNAEEALRRLCMPKQRSGRIEVADEIKEKFAKGGSSRDEMISVYLKGGRDKDRPNINAVLVCVTALTALRPVSSVRKSSSGTCCT